MIGGLYLGELVRLVLVHLAQRGVLFGGHTSPSCEAKAASSWNTWLRWRSKCGRQGGCDKGTPGLGVAGVVFP